MFHVYVYILYVFLGCEKSVSNLSLLPFIHLWSVTYSNWVNSSFEKHQQVFFFKKKANYFCPQEEEEEPEGKPSDAESSETSDDEKGWVEEVRKQRRLLRQEEKVKRQERSKEDQQTVLKPQFFEIKAGEEFRSFKDTAKRQKLLK